MAEEVGRQRGLPAPPACSRRGGGVASPTGGESDGVRSIEGLPRGLTEKGEERTCASRVVSFVRGWNNCLCMPSCVLAKDHAQPGYLTGPPLRTRPTLTPLHPSPPLHFHTNTHTHYLSLSLTHTHTTHHLKRRDPSIRIDSLSTLFVLSKHPMIATLIAEAGGVPVICGVLIPETPETPDGATVIRISLSIIQQLCLAGEGTIDEVCQCGVVAKLKELATRGAKDVAGVSLFAPMVGISRNLLVSPVSEGMPRQSGVYDVVSLLCGCIYASAATSEIPGSASNSPFRLGFNLLQSLENATEDPLNAASLCRSAECHHFFDLIEQAGSVRPGGRRRGSAESKSAAGDLPWILVRRKRGRG